MPTQDLEAVRKLKSGIEGLDHITKGGIPIGRATLVAGTAGSAKTIFGVQFLAAGIAKFDEPGVFVTFEESPSDIRKNVKSLGWDIQAWEDARKWKFVDASPEPSHSPVSTGHYDLGALIARIENAVREVGAKRVVLDSLGAIFSQLGETAQIRHELFRTASALRKLDVTAVITAERLQDYGAIARYGIEEFVADNVIILRNILEEEKRRRTIEILKFRGTEHSKGEYPFTVTRDGIVVIPLSAIELKQRSSNIRVSSGNPSLDEMCGGGFFRDSIILISGATGTGKTLSVAHFVKGAAEAKEKCLLFAFEESREQLIRNATGWGLDYESMEKAGLLKVVCDYPEVKGLEDHLIAIKQTIAEFKPNRIAVDSMSALERVSSLKSFREFVIGLTSFIKHQEMTGLFTSTTPTLMGGTSITEAHISTITDSIILLRYVEIYGEMRRGLTVLKMRGSKHVKEIREFNIDEHGMHIGKAFRNVSGILGGVTTQLAQNEVDRISRLFDPQASEPKS
ncbi:MAG: circadian clock protein KaiC [Archangiaceae bacterium]|nr:circadian clock protein KaiC [Archangiaceae bacterium]